MGCKGMTGMRERKALSRTTRSRQGATEMRGEEGTVAICCRLPKSGRSWRRAVESYRGLPKGGRKVEDRECHK
jgi:hypothetical protein